MTTVAPTEATQYTIGRDVTCTDGECGELRRVVIDPVASRLTHLVVERRHQTDTGRLVPIDLVTTTDEKGIHLGCTTTQFETLEDAEETKFLPGESGAWGYGPGQVMSWPYYGIGGMGGMGMGGMGLGGMGLYSGPQAVTSDRVPAGETEVRRGQHVQATDGKVGRVQGLVVDAADHAVTHILLAEGHLWSKKTVAIPMSAVASVVGDVTLKITKDEVGNLPTVDVDQPA